MIFLSKNILLDIRIHRDSFNLRIEADMSFSLIEFDNIYLQLICARLI
jgi:hypothetical protein